MHSFMAAVKYWIIFTGIAGALCAVAFYVQLELKPIPEWTGLVLSVLPIIVTLGYLKSRRRLEWLKHQHKAIVQAAMTCGLMTTTWLVVSLTASQIDSGQLRQFSSYLSLSYLVAVLIFGIVLIYALFANHDA